MTETRRVSGGLYVVVLSFCRSASLTLLALLLVSCSKDERLPGHVYYRLSAEPTTLDPALVVDVTGGAVTAKLFNGLLRLGKGLEVEPDLAESWEVSPDGLIYRFKLRRGVKFSTGREATALDFKYSFERVLDPRTRSPKTWLFDRVLGAREFMAGRADGVSGIRAVDDYSLEIELAEPFSPFANLLTMPGAYVVPREEVEKWGPDFSSHPVGTGPYVLKEWLPNTRLVLERRGDYFEGPPRAGGIVYRVIPEDLTAVAEFELGRLDVMSIPASEYSRYRGSEKWRGLIDSIEGLNTYYLGLNCERPPFNDPRLRQAVSRAIDRRRILETIYEGRGVLANGPVPPILRKWPSPEPYGFDPEAARGLVNEAGAKGRAVDFYITSEQQVVDTAEVIQSYLRGAGLDVRLRQLEWSAFKEAVNKGEADMFWLSWWADYADPENFLYPLFHSSNLGPAGNRARYSDQEVDRLISLGQRAASREARDGYYGGAEAAVVADAPWVFFWHRAEQTIRQPWVRGFELYPVYSMDKGLGVWLER